jgi:3-deoxy-D-manno-octulosonic-acid transferase
LVLLYYSGLLIYYFIIRVVALWNPKARLWINGRKGLLTRIEKETAAFTIRPIWMHCASLGEFEQGRPVLEAIREQYPNTPIVLTFYSPSGYEIRKNYAGADLIFYLPPDSPRNARQFLNAVNPQLAIFVKYEFWHFYLRELRLQNIPTLLISAIFRPKQAFFKPYGAFWRKMLDSFTHFFVQTKASADLLQTLKISGKVTVSGDTRFDRVIAIAGNPEPLPLIAAFCGNFPVVVAGSTWIEDEEVLDHFAKTHQEVRFIIAPHEIHEARLKEIEKLFEKTIRFSKWKQMQETGNQRLPVGINVLIIDNIGMLSRLYKYADITYIGGAFGGDGIHNILEAVVYYKPVVFGPIYEGFKETTELVDAGGAETVENALELEKVFKTLLTHKDLREQKGKISGDYVRENAGATALIMKYIQEKRLLTN